MQTKPQKEITLAEIISALDTMSLADARTELYKSFNASLFLRATVLKVVKRSGFKLYVEVAVSTSTRKMEAFCEFEESEIEKAVSLKVRKSSRVSLTGRFQTCGTNAMMLYGCRLAELQKKRIATINRSASRSEANLLAPVN